MNNKKSNSKYFTIVAGILFVLILMGIYWFYTSIPSNYIKTTATETNSIAGPKAYFQPEHFQFIDKNGQTVTFSWREFGFSQAAIQGTTRTVYYNPNNPKQAKAYTSKTTYIITYTTLIVIAVFVAVSPKIFKKK